MIDINLIVENPEYVSKSLAKKNCHVELSEIISWVEKRRQLIGKSEKLKAEKNTFLKELQGRKQNNEDITEILERLSVIKDSIGNYDPKIKELTSSINDCAYPHI